VATNDQITSSVPGRYASALFDLSQEQSQLQAVERDMDTIQALLEESDDLNRMVRSPVFSADDQSKAMEALLTKVGVSGLTLNFVKLIIRNRRLFALQDMIKMFRIMAANARGEVQADVISAVELKDEHRLALQEALKEASGRDVSMNTYVDPSLIGGLIVKVGSRMIDMSLRTKLSTLKMRMKEVG